jgi:hypothetical protein
MRACLPSSVIAQKPKSYNNQPALTNEIVENRTMNRRLRNPVLS